MRRFPFEFESPHEPNFFSTILISRSFERYILSRDHENNGHSTSTGKEHALQESDLARWELVTRAMLKYQPKQSEYSHTDLRDTRKAILYNSVCDRMRNWSVNSVDGANVHMYNDPFILLTVSIAGGLYGGLHLLAWNTIFLSSSLRTCWLVSSILIASTGPTLLVYGPMKTWRLGPIFSLFRGMLVQLTSLSFRTRISLSWFHFLDGLSLSMILDTLPLYFLSAYFLARVFLITVSCIQLARLPPTAYELPEWSRYFPHIG